MTHSQDLQTARTFGSFSEDGTQFRIHDIHTPRPWVNVMCNGRYGTICSQSGGGFSWLDNSQMQRLNRWDQDLTVEPFGSWLYVQDDKQIWSASYLPTRLDADRDEVIHGSGETTYIRELSGIKVTQTRFVPLDIQCEFWIVEVENLRAEEVSISLCSYVDWHLGGQGDWHREFQRLFIETQIRDNFMLAWKHTGLRENTRLIEKVPYVAYHALVGARVDAWFGDKPSFLGSPGDPAKPEGLLSGGKGDTTGRWDDPIAAAKTSIQLKPGEKKTLVYALGCESDLSEARARASSLTIELAQASLERLRLHWAELNSRSAVSTPNENFNHLNNTWLKVQTIVGRMDGRTAYYQQGGAFGYRDQLQDSLAWLYLDPKRTLKQLMIHAEAMYSDGGVRHWWHPGTNIFAESHHSDTCLWLAFGTLTYLDETNDLAALDQRCRYLSRETQTFGETGTLLDHCLRGIDRALNKLSPRGLPLIGAGDWNDGLSHAGLEGKGESVWVAMFLYGILRRWQPILIELGDEGRAHHFDQAAQALAHAVEQFGWDGSWYTAGTNDQGRPFGSASNAEGQIFLNPQTWAVLTEIGPFDRAEIAISNAANRLFKPYGALLLHPAYAKVDPEIGYITRYAPGLRENGGVYSHASTWAVLALAKMGRADDALAMYQAMMPCKPAALQESYAAEPYVMPGNVDGPDSPHEGKAGWTWYTGSSAWMIRAAFEGVLGIRASREGLRISNGPTEWEHYEVTRLFRRRTYQFEVIGKGQIQSIEANGRTVSLDEPILQPAGSEPVIVKIRRS